MKTITHAELIERTIERKMNLGVQKLSEGQTDAFVIVAESGVKRLYYPESDKVRQALEQLQIIGPQPVFFAGIGPTARIHWEPIGPDDIEEQTIETAPDDDPPPPGLMAPSHGAGYVGPPTVKPPTAQQIPRVIKQRGGFLSRLIGPRQSVWDEHVGLPPIPGTDLTEPGQQLLGALIEAARIVDAFEARVGRPMNRNDRAIGATLFIDEQKRSFTNAG